MMIVLLILKKKKKNRPKNTKEEEIIAFQVQLVLLLEKINKENSKSERTIFKTHEFFDSSIMENIDIDFVGLHVLWIDSTQCLIGQANQQIMCEQLIIIV